MATSAPFRKGGCKLQTSCSHKKSQNLFGVVFHILMLQSTRWKVAVGICSMCDFREPGIVTWLRCNRSNSCATSRAQSEFPRGPFIDISHHISLLLQLMYEVSHFSRFCNSWYCEKCAISAVIAVSQPVTTGLTKPLHQIVIHTHETHRHYNGDL